MHSGQIVAKYTQKQPNERGKRAKNTEEIVVKYTQNSNFCAPPSPSSFLQIVEQFRHFSPAVAPNKWTLWGFECRDFPVHNGFKNNKNACQFCMALYEFGMLFKNSFYESRDRWDGYLQKVKSFDVDDRAPLQEELARFLPSKLAKDIFFNRKLGVAVFRDGITPKIEGAENCTGGFFRMRLFATSGQNSVSLLSKMDELLVQSLRLIFDASPTIACHVNGLFIRWQIDPDSKGEEEEEDNGGKGRKKGPYCDMHELPIIGKLEIWMNDRRYKGVLEKCLIKNGIDRVIPPLALPPNAFSKFRFLKRFQNGSYRDFTSKLGQRMTCSSKTFNALKSMGCQ